MKSKKYIYVILVVYVGIIINIAEQIVLTGETGANRTLVILVTLSLLILISSISYLIIKVMRMKE